MVGVLYYERSAVSQKVNSSAGKGVVVAPLIKGLGQVDINPSFPLADNLTSAGQPGKKVQPDVKG
jgi:hypothetical protein